MARCHPLRGNASHRCAGAGGDDLSGDKQGGSYNNGLIQPFLNYNFREGLYLTSAPILTVDWKANGGSNGRVDVSQMTARGMTMMTLATDDAN